MRVHRVFVYTIARARARVCMCVCVSLLPASSIMPDIETIERHVYDYHMDLLIVSQRYVAREEMARETSCIVEYGLSTREK
jgi:hypothetical protein